ncbi:MAG: glycosyltransferase [Actinobacteria bacterium]|nr:MAG: glycosyltransferase [Actinomycetota bacterium]
MEAPTISVIIPVHNEGEPVVPLLDAVFQEATSPIEVLVVFDMPEDTTAPVLAQYAEREPRVHPTLNTYGLGPANAIRYGLDQASAPVAVVMMADGSDDPAQIEHLASLVADDGAVIGAASRYMKGGRQIGGPFIKRTLSRLAGLSLHLIGRVGTHDATNSYKAYSTAFVTAVGVDSDQGFEIGIELVAKAKRARLPVAEIPTTWRDRSAGESRFRVLAWIPHYLKWYLHALGPARRLDLSAGRRARP